VSQNATLNRCTAIRCISLLLLSILSFFLHADDWSYTVRPGDNLWNITDKLLLDQSYRTRLQEYNNIQNGDVIQPGSLLSIPVPWLKVKPASATLISFSGTVEIRRADGTSDTSPDPGNQLNAADSVATSANSSAIVEFADGSRIFLDPETTVTLNTISSHDQNGMIDTSFRLRGGRVESRVIPGATPETRFRVLTPPAIAAVKGTDFNVAYEPDNKKTLAEVSTGLVGMNAAGVEVEVPAGFGSATIQGEAPGKPVKRLPGADLSGLQDRLLANQVSFIWPVVSGSAFYTVELLESQNGEFVSTHKIEKPEIQFLSLAINTYTMQVRAVDDVGLRSDVAIHEFEVVANPRAPLLNSPNGNSDHIEPEMTFSWEDNSGIGKYNFQLSTADSFVTLLVDTREIPQANYQPLSPIVPGDYYWRVSFTDSKGNTSDWSDTRRFTMYEKPGVPILNDVSFRQQALVTRWDKQSHAIAYKIVISTDSKFDQVIVQQRTEDSSYVLENAPTGQLYLRVASIGQADYVSEYSDIVVIEKKSFWEKYGALVALFCLLIIFMAVFYRRGR